MQALPLSLCALSLRNTLSNKGITLQFLCTLRVIPLVVKAASVESCGQYRLVWQVLVKMLNSGLFSELNGCVSTGKEANVYQAVTAGGEDLAVKIYKTSILTFKDRDRSAACSHMSSAQNKYYPILQDLATLHSCTSS